ncbi:MAG: carboxypeptidase regulatory-like domain-containing protein, partial [Terriglobia bacterium]
MNIQQKARALGFAALVCAFLLFGFSPLAAQIATGGITGTVLDPSGAAVPGANITLSNVATGVNSATRSTATGNYSFSGLPPGTYTIQTSASGFQNYVVHGVVVHLQQIQTEDIHLKTGNVQQSVTVTAAAPLVQAESGQIGQTVSNQAVENLPLVTRNWGSLAQLSAGVNTAPPGQPTPDSGSTEGAYFSVNGVNVWQNDFRLNGINDNIEIYGGNYTGTNAAIVPPPDAVQEFKVQTGDFNAAFGHSTGGVINAVVKSGTNSLHGDLWEYIRNDAFNANCFFCGNKSAEYRQNIFGVTAGGPIVRNKTFWFFDYQGQRYVTP